tara:strand:+ start:4519 stop:4704 length:186 start_codon:yes stop_codon:yes gene_type:complete
MEYQIKKTIREKNLSTLLNDSLGVVLEFKEKSEVEKFCEILNANSDSNCKYEIVIINSKEK